MPVVTDCGEVVSPGKAMKQTLKQKQTAASTSGERSDSRNATL